MKRDIKLLLTVIGRCSPPGMNPWAFVKEMKLKSNAETMAFLWPLAAKAISDLYGPPESATAKVPHAVIDAVYRLVANLPRKALIAAAKSLEAADDGN